MNIVNYGAWASDHGHVSAEAIVTGAGSTVNLGVDVRWKAIDAQLERLLVELEVLQGLPTARTAAFGIEEMRRELGAGKPDHGRLNRLLGGVADAVGAIGQASRLVTQLADIDHAIRTLF